MKHGRTASLPTERTPIPPSALSKRTDRSLEGGPLIASGLLVPVETPVSPYLAPFSPG